jgi:GNAT superfamily N-acetyltransferase
VEELPALLRLVNRVFRPDGGDMQREYPLVFQPGNAAHLRVIDREGEIVAHVGVCVREALLLGIPLRVASIGAVCTDPAVRGQGLASRLMEDARGHALAHGADLMLISGGRGLYHRLGYVTVGRFPRYRVPTAPPSAAVTVGEHAPADLASLRALYEREPVRFRRSGEDWERLLAAGMLMNRRARLFVVRLQGAPVAYLGVQEPSPGRDGGPTTARAAEVAGDRWAVAEGAGAVAGAAGADLLELVGPDGDTTLAGQARARGWEAGISSFAGTLAVLRPAAFVQQLGPYITERLGERLARELRVTVAGDGLCFCLGEESAALPTRGMVTALLFGGETEEARAVPPLAGRLGETLAALFPLPLLWYGYNYV